MDWGALIQKLLGNMGGGGMGGGGMMGGGGGGSYFGTEKVPQPTFNGPPSVGFNPTTSTATAGAAGAASPASAPTEAPLARGDVWGAVVRRLLQNMRQRQMGAAPAGYSGLSGDYMAPGEETMRSREAF